MTSCSCDRPSSAAHSIRCPAPLGALDARHLATAPAWRDYIGPLQVMATHDEARGLAARAFGFDVIGL